MSTPEHIAESEEPTAADSPSTPTPALADDETVSAQAAEDTVAEAPQIPTDTAPAGEAEAAPPSEAEAEAAPPREAEAEAEAAPSGEAKAQAKQKAEGSSVVEGPLVPGLASDFLKLVHLSTKYPEIGPPVAELAFKTGYSDLGQRIIKVGLESDAPGLEHYTVAAKHAKHMRQYDEAMRYCSDAVRTMATSPERYADADDGAKLLHLVRLGFTILMFELKDTGAHPLFISTLQEELPRLAARMETDPFFHTLRAQVLWYTDREASEQAWDRAAELGEAEFAFNARGTWYKEAEHDTDKAEGAYRKGLEQVPGSSLLQHNLAQVLLEKARRQPEGARRLLQEARALVKSALLGDCPRGLRRHIYNTRTELDALQDSLRQSQAKSGEKQPRRERPRPEGEKREGGERQEEERKRPEYQVGQVVKGRVRSLTAFGAFVALEGGISGLLHKSEMAHEMVADPAQVVQVGEEVEVKIIEMGEGERGRPRIGLSRRALLPAPERPERPERQDRPDRQDRPRGDGRRRDHEGGRRREGGPGPREGQGQRPREGHAQGQGGQGQGGPRRDRDRPPQAQAQDRPPERPNERPYDREGRGQGQRGGGKPAGATSTKLASLGEMLLAKLKEQQESKGS